MMIMQHLLLLFFLFGVSVSNGARILAIFPYEMKSHRGVLEPIAEELAQKGHQVDVISYFTQNKKLPNYTNILTLPASEKPPIVKFSLNRRPIDDFPWAYNVNKKACELFGHPVIRKLIKNPPTDPPYSLLIVHLISDSQCFSAIGVKWNIPIVGVVTTMLYTSMLPYLNIPINLASMSRHYYSYEENLNFWGRVYNTIMTNYYLYHFNCYVDYQDYYIKKYLGPDMPSYREVEKSFSLILSNSHYLYHGVKAQPPALIEIGGINIKNDSSQMDPKLKKVLDESKDGFIYFSFGSIIVLESLQPEILEKFYKTFRMISPVRIILKSVDTKALSKNLPNNVFTFSWLPQQKVLQHSNIKAFVTHGGALGTQEAIYYKVPMICVPFFAEQRVNCDILSIKNISLKLKLQSAEQEDYNYVFTQILKNPLYKRSIDEFSKLYFDRPLSPRESVTYWIEFVLRHGKHVLRTQGLDLKWWQLELLDVYTFLIACALTIIFTVVFIIWLILKYFVGRLRLVKQMKSNKKIK